MKEYLNSDRVDVVEEGEVIKKNEGGKGYKLKGVKGWRYYESGGRKGMKKNLIENTREFTGRGSEEIPGYE